MRVWIPLGTTLVVCSSTLAQPVPVPRIGPQIKVDSAPPGAAANETTAAASEDDPTTIIVGWNDGRDLDFGPPPVPSGRVGFATSFDGGTTWVPHTLMPNPPLTHSDGDPVTAQDPRTGTLWGGFVQFFPTPRTLWVARLGANDTEFDPPVPAFDEGLDKPWLTGVVPRSPVQLPRRSRLSDVSRRRGRQRRH